jgi:hypothetical protein
MGPINRLLPLKDPAKVYFDAIPHETVNELAKILKGIENYLVTEVFPKFPKEWHLKNIEGIAIKGTLKEKGFYELIDWPYPGNSGAPLSRYAKLFELFPDSVRPESPETKKLREEPIHPSTTSPAENFKRFISLFYKLLEAHLPNGNAGHVNLTNTCKAPIARMASTTTNGTHNNGKLPKN